MQLETGSVYYGFKLLSQRKIDEINSTARVFSHVKSGARLFSLENDDDNKVFSISFRTPPKDSTGTPHILEHSVLCGSRKFPTKEPFVELAKGSLNTFLNALTFSDKTMYPVASKNDKDFYNLMDVYLDAVFYPNIYKYPEIFMQEGWHYELDDSEGDMTYKGVVYNEMKGAFSAPESILFRKIQESLYPDTPYGVESGGDPDVIPKLSLEEFLAFHKKYYHPSNSYIYLYGNGNTLEQMKFIDENYLRYFDKADIDSGIPVQEAFKEMKEVDMQYPISPDEDDVDKTFLSMNFSTGRSTVPDTYLALEILEYLLLETPASPLKKALIEADLGKDVFGQYDNSILQPVFSIVVKNSNQDKKDEFKNVVLNTLRRLVEKGIDKKLIEAAINKIEFELREAEGRGMPKGLLYGIRCMDSWLYGADPSIHLEYEPVLKEIKSALTTDYFERLIEKYLLNNPHCSLIMLKPEKGLAERKAREVRDKLARYKSSLNPGEIQRIIDRTRKLKERQAALDSPEDLRKIPLLDIKDIEPKAKKLELVEEYEHDVKILYHPAFTNRIGYINLFFDSSSVPVELLPYVGLLSDVLGKVSTESLNYADLSNEININTGGIDFISDAYTVNMDPKKYYPKFIIRSKALVEKVKNLFEIVSQIIRSSSFEDERRLKEIIQETRSQLEMRVFDRGHVVAARRLYSYFSSSGYYLELVSGLAYYKFIKGLEKDFDSKLEEVRTNLKRVSDHIFNTDNLILGVTCDRSDYDGVKQCLSSLFRGLNSTKQNGGEYDFELSPRNEGLLTPGKVQYVAKGYNFIKLGYTYSGTLQVLRTITAYDYLWGRVRVRGGAYGAFNRFDRNGDMYFVSYRDPNLKETVAVYDGTSNFVKNFTTDDREMVKYIIGTISRVDSPLTPSMEGEVAVENYIRNITYEDIQKERDEILSTKQEDIKSLAGLISDVMKQSYICVLGSEEKIKENSDMFSNMINVFE